MLKVPTFIIGGILILTGLTGYLMQDQGLTLKITGPLADDASLVLSDGVQEHTLDFIPCPDSAGENVWWIAHKLNEGHAGIASQKNFATENGANDNDLQSFWYASSRGDTMEGLLLESKRYNSAGTGEKVSIDWNTIDVNSSTLRIIYKNVAGNTGPVTLTSNNWENIELNPVPEAGDSLTFSKSWTAFIPGIIGILLIILAQAAEMKPNARKHIMHAAVLVGLLGFIMSAKRIGGAVAEMNWLKNEPYGIIHASMLKPLSMLFTSGLLLIFVILCILSFINARKEMAAQAKAEEERKKKVLKKVKSKNQDAEKTASDAKEKSKSKDEDEEKSDDHDKEKPKTEEKQMQTTESVKDVKKQEVSSEPENNQEKDKDSSSETLPDEDTKGKNESSDKKTDVVSSPEAAPTPDKSSSSNENKDSGEVEPDKNKDTEEIEHSATKKKDEPSTDSGQPEKKEESSTSEDQESEDSNAEKSKD